MPETQALVSIAIPTVDRLDYLKEAVASAVAQTYEHIEVLIGDDGPTLEIEEWSKGISASDCRVRYQRNQKHLGLAGNWNALADAAHGEFLIIIGDDDRLLPHFVERLIEISRSSAQVAFSNHYLIDSNGARLKTESTQMTRSYHRHKLSAGEIINPAVCVWQNSVPMSSAMVRTRDIQRLRFKEDLNTPEIEFYARLAQEGGRFFFTPEYLTEYRVHNKSATSTGLAGEKLVKYLAPIPVPADVEPYKKRFMETLLVNAVTRCLQQGERTLARQFLNHEYYPDIQLKRPKDALTSYIQGLCTFLPSSVGSPTYRLLQTAKSHLLGNL